MIASHEVFHGHIARTHEDSTPWWPEPESPHPDPPNVVYVVLDDVGDQTGTGRLFIENDNVAEVPFPRVLPNFHGREALDIGKASLVPVKDSYRGEFPFTGELDRVVFELASSEDLSLHDPSD